MADLSWLDALLKDDEFGSIGAHMAAMPADVRFVADDASYALLHAAFEREGLATGVLAQSRYFDIALMLDFEIRRVVVVDSVNEDDACERLVTLLGEEGVPRPILQTMRFEGFVADWLPRVAARLAPEDLGQADTPDPAHDFPSTLYAIISAPRSGSTFLAGLLSASGLGQPIEHLRPWLVQLARTRPADLFDGVRFIQNLICLCSTGGVFGTKLISHFVQEILPHLTTSERAYLRELAGRHRIIYLVREDKLDQAVSSIRARETGVWHATEAAPRERLAAGALHATVQDVAAEIRYFEVQEQMVAAWMIHQRSRYAVSYEELSQSADWVLPSLAGYLGLNIRPSPTSRYVKLSDEASQGLRGAYLETVGGSAPSALTPAETLREAWRRRQADREETARRSTAIRQGHATSKAGDYQDRHYYLLDYRSTHVPGLVFPCRGPIPGDVDAGGYLAFLGAAQTFGAFVHRPFPEQVGQSLGREVLNLGRGGGGPAFFTALPRVMELVGKAGAVVVQAMAARMLSNSRFQSIEGRAAVRYREPDGSTTQMDCDQAWTRALQEEGPEGVTRLVEESRANWIGDMHAIAAAASGPTVLLYFGMRARDYTIGYRDVWSLYGDYPQMVTGAMLDAVRPAFSAFVEVVSTSGLPEPTVSAFSGEALPVVFGGGRLEEQNILNVNAYYPSQAMNDEAAQAVVAALRPLL